MTHSADPVTIEFNNPLSGNSRAAGGLAQPGQPTRNGRHIKSTVEVCLRTVPFRLVYYYIITFIFISNGNDSIFAVLESFHLLLFHRVLRFKQWLEEQVSNLLRLKKTSVLTPLSQENSSKSVVADVALGPC